MPTGTPGSGQRRNKRTPRASGGNTMTPATLRSINASAKKFHTAYGNLRTALNKCGVHIGGRGT